MPAPYRLYPDFPRDFEARVRILRPEESGRQRPPYNGIRWDFSYAPVTSGVLHMMLYPDFFDPITGDSWREMPLPVDKWLPARVSVVSEQMRVGTSLYYCEGSRIVAEGTVTRIIGLFESWPQA
ncbi:hypothetical protein KLP40_15975 [Hymenobacter sp. NST-14]|uniref:hypothetical protein n=1 Tax=Hymenobacter piscis TaxID=2839984 RepID=UPI001C031B07|nr:hypothetical protein [Hymenobacter piscis]MBT9394670.1 hypothetical protein [Hymenobacter piscis]